VSEVALAFAQPTPARPGPGPVPEKALRALDITVRRRIESLLAGEHRSASLGIAMELAQVRPYQPGDDVRLIDWNATARMNEPHVRLHVAERALTTWLVFDGSASMGFGTALRRKADVAEGVVLAVGHVASRRGNRLGLMSYGHEDSLFVPPRQGRVGLVGVLLQMQQLAARGDAATPAHSDGLGDAGTHVRVDTGRKRLRERYAAAAAEDRELVARDIRSAGAHHLILSTGDDWLRPLVLGLANRPVLR